MPQPTKPQLAIYAAFAIAVLLIGARVLRGGEPGAGAAGAAPATVLGGVDGAVDGSSADPGEGAAGGAGGVGSEGAGSGSGAAAGSGFGVGSESAGGIVVDVKGAVRRPGVYRLPDGARALDAVQRAGGVTRRADRLGVNLAARIVDGGEVVVPRRGAGAGAGSVAGAGASGAAASGVSGAGASGGAGAAAGPLVIDLNTATATELEQLDGVGPATAAKIVAYREANGGIASIDELDEVSGIGEAKLAAIHAQLGR